MVLLKPVEFREYMLITGDMLKHKLASAFYEKEAGNIIWKNKNGDVLGTRKKNKNGIYEHKIEENIYRQWVRNR